VFPKYSQLNRQRWKGKTSSNRSKMKNIVDLTWNRKTNCAIDNRKKYKSKMTLTKNKQMKKTGPYDKRMPQWSTASYCVILALSKAGLGTALKVKQTQQAPEATNSGQPNTLPPPYMWWGEGRTVQNNSHTYWFPRQVLCRHEWAVVWAWAKEH
jgi:hypothetical protein